MSTAEQAAVAALREAAQALSAGDQAGRFGGKISDSPKPDVATEVAAMLEAAVGLLHTVDLQPAPVGGPGHSLHAVAQHMSAGAELARRTASGHGDLGPPDSSHPEPRLRAE